MSSNLQDDRAALEVEKEKAAEAKAFWQFFNERPDLNYASAKSLLISYHNGESITLKSLRESADRLVANGSLQKLSVDRVESDAATAKREAADAEQIERENLTKWIIANRSQSTSAAEHEEARFLNPRATDITTLRTIKENIVAKRALASKIVPELRTIVRGEEPTPEDLPSQISRNQILHLMDASSIRHLIARYGAAAVTKRVNEGRKED